MNSDTVNFILFICFCVAIDTIGYIIKCRKNERFATYHLRRIPTMWIWFS